MGADDRGARVRLPPSEAGGGAGGWGARADTRGSPAAGILLLTGPRWLRSPAIGPRAGPSGLGD